MHRSTAKWAHPLSRRRLRRGFALVHLAILLACTKAPDRPANDDPLVIQPAASTKTTSHLSEVRPRPPTVDVMASRPSASPSPSPAPIPVSETYAWSSTPPLSDQTLLARVPTPPQYKRIPVEAGSFGAWLRTLPIKAGDPAVRLHDGRLKANQEAHHLVIDIDVGSGNLQQCADAVMRLRAEYLYAQKRYSDIHFRFTTGDVASYPKWQQGYRPRVQGNSVEWALTARGDTTYAGFRKYMTSVFTYAGTASLSREMQARPVEDMQIGDVFILGGYPGHAVIVLDMAQHEKDGKKVFLLGQSYMPAQDMHVLRNPNDDGLSPWYRADFGSTLVTPEWKFSSEQLMHFTP